MNDASRLILRTEQLCKAFPDGQVRALAGVDLSIPTGEYLAVMGPSGSGKSSLLSALGALDEPTSGRVFFQGQPLEQIRSLDRLRAEKIGFVFQSFQLLPTLTALENVQIPMFETRLRPGERAQKAARLLHSVQMAHRIHHRPSRLSVGERQRVAIARALANDPILLLADEPTGNLDTQIADEVLSLLEQLWRARGMTLVIVTHSHEVAARANRVIQLRDGQIVSDSVGNQGPGPPASDPASSARSGAE